MAPSSAVLLLGVIGIGSTAGRFFLGGLADRIGRQTSLLLMFAGMALALAVWVDLDRHLVSLPPSRSSMACSTADGSRCFRPW